MKNVSVNKSIDTTGIITVVSSNTRTWVSALLILVTEELLQACFIMTSRELEVNMLNEHTVDLILFNCLKMGWLK